LARRVRATGRTDRPTAKKYSKRNSMTRIHPGYVTLACEQPLLRAPGTSENDALVKTPVPDDPADPDRRQAFAVRANSILAFVECSDQQRPKLRDAIIEAMLWAQTQP
jgi:hypothetical protein